MSVNENKYNCFFQNVSSLSAPSLFTEKVRYDTTIEFNGVEAIKQCVMVRVGVTILPEITVAEDISQGLLAALFWAEGDLEVAALMIWYRDRWLSPTLSAFMEAVRKIVKEGYERA